MQAILTKFHGPTNIRGSRISATCAGGRVIVPYPHDLSGQECHEYAAKKLVNKLGWTGDHYGKLEGGQLHTGDYCFVMVKGA